MSIGQSVTRHPDLEEIISLFNEGTDEQVRLLSMLEDQLSQANSLGNTLSDNNQRIRMFEAMSRLIAENRQFLDSVHRRQSEEKAPINIQNAQINITQVNNYMDSIKEAVVETFRTTHPDLLPQFLMVLSDKLATADVIEAEVVDG